MSADYGPATKAEAKMTSLRSGHSLQGVFAGNKALGLEGLRLLKYYEWHQAVDVSAAYIWINIRLLMNRPSVGNDTGA